MYYSDEPKRPKKCLPISKEIRTLGFISGMYLPVALLTPVIVAFVPTLTILAAVAVADITLFVICLINPATPKRKLICRIVGIAGGALTLLIALCCLLVLVGILPPISFTNTSPYYIGRLFG